jgi:hypothetical protein
MMAQLFGRSANPPPDSGEGCGCELSHTVVFATRERSLPLAKGGVFASAISRQPTPLGAGKRATVVSCPTVDQLNLKFRCAEEA